MFENFRVFFNKRKKSLDISTLLVGGREKLLRAPKFLSGIVVTEVHQLIVTFSPWRPGGPASPFGPGAPAGPDVPGEPGSPGEPRSP